MRRETTKALSALERSWEALDRLRVQANQQAAEEAPEHAFSKTQYAAKYGLKYSTGAEQVTRLFRQGSLHQGKGLRPDCLGRLILTTVYWPK
jgi:hypothetical protein